MTKTSSRTSVAIPHEAKVVRMKLFKETKGAVRYVEIDSHGGVISTDEENVVLASAYIRKKALREWVGTIPKNITFTITEE